MDEYVTLYSMGLRFVLSISYLNHEIASREYTKLTIYLQNGQILIVYAMSGILFCFVS